MPRTFLITGASKGIGLALARRLAQAGDTVIGLARQAADDFPGILASVDLSDAEATETTLAILGQRYRFDGVVNNVGLVRPQRLGAVDLGTLDAVLRLNLHPALQTVQGALPGMRSVGGDGSSTSRA